ncbi:MAG: 2-oxoacid:acceptor oxidoreductase subunit alpha [Bacteroidales bacterium]|jgi:2-oxoglutarate ferredoxin oxidoreductase subunit alpha|nr:2-oxoacid:acceptor oxidoreductase subunit alpha [Bacteroidales bacterium]MBQ1882888.1 2-oxoacid:acceptor oxidoreductase subunit alpha [Bacteroidales bacterium]MBQ2483409.1 2-oxoacid:acceptor oxidoreductase subunit alpha [Bacteroidales bacterium]MBQ2493543.1 2-oxoacid:acceptor oxidoreductase subunit alpha [Bacteroidales bacterium]MBQ4196894.1 2-oxoacid:acceptor oxidoreductase subunit alpha [Bacteroidales bacterium]
MERKVVDVKDVVIRFTGDSGDGMQLTGTLFADASALYGNEISTFPDYPAEIRAPQGTVSGVSGFQVHIGQGDVKTPGDLADVLVSMNPAALMANAKFAKPGGSIILDEDSFDKQGLEKAGFKTLDPVEELNLQDYNIIWAPITSLTKESLKDSGMDLKSIVRCKNIFTLGMCYFMFNRPLHFTEAYLRKKFAKKPDLIEPNIKVLNDGYNYAHNTHAIGNTYTIEPAKLEKGVYRSINGNQATAWGLIAASEKSGRPMFVGSYPITPATAILEELAIHKNLGVKTMQCEDEISGICTSIGAAYAGNMAVTTTSGPGLSLKSEALGLACIAELPLVVVDVQRSGPSTGIPTKTEQTDLGQALYGRNGECPVMVMAARTPSDCFRAAFYAAKYAMEHMMPVVFLSEGYLGNGSEPWKIPSMSDYPSINPPIITECEGKFKPFERDPQTFVRKWAIPGTPGLEHRVGGLEKTPAGAVSSDPEVHEMMVRNRATKLAKVADCIPELEVYGQKEADVLLVGWGGTYGHLYTATSQLLEEGKSVGFAQFDYINPLPKNTAEVFSHYKKILVCELNSGQFADYLRAKLPQFKYLQLNKVQGQPFMVHEIVDAVKAL